MHSLSLMTILRIALPGGVVIRLTDGGFVTYQGETYQGLDPVFGTIGSVQSMAEGVGDEIPALEITLLPPETSGPAQLTAPGYQNSIVQLAMGEFDPDAGVFIGDPDLMFIGQIDQPSFRVGNNRRELTLSVVSTAERLFMANDGNSLTPRWQKEIWPGDRGHDNAVGLTIPVAWGVEQRPVAGSGGADIIRRNGWGAIIK